jgi:hypothetical protein
MSIARTSLAARVFLDLAVAFLMMLLCCDMMLAEDYVTEIVLKTEREEGLV